MQPSVRWDVDGSPPLLSDVPNSVYLITGPCVGLNPNSEIHITYGNKGNEELLFLYGFAHEDNASEFVMIHYPKAELHTDPCCEVKAQLLEVQGLSLRWLLPKSILHPKLASSESSIETSKSPPFVPEEPIKSENTTRETPSRNEEQENSGYLSSIEKVELGASLFPENVLAALRIVAMTEEEVGQVVEVLQERHASSNKEISEGEARLVIWELCGNQGALQLLQHLFERREEEMIEGTGSEEKDIELLKRHKLSKSRAEELAKNTGGDNNVPEGRFEGECLSHTLLSCLLYRVGQKSVVRRFLDVVNKELFHAMDLQYGKK